ncbi:MAG: hypothetical protein GY799_01525 [Desulfobulbaceae bacterium]|nr:hypothetical protein [Desulfobulbaceae bacterium]
MAISKRSNRFLISAFLVMIVLLSLGTFLSAESVSPSNVVTGKAEKQLVSEKSKGSLPLKDWLTFAGTVTAALIAGIFAIYQLRRSTSAQRALEREKLLTARTEAELAQVRSTTREYRQAQALPFLEQLDKTLNESYTAAYMPPYFPDLGGYIPQLRRYADRAMIDWFVANEAMSRHRIRLLLVLNHDRVEIVTSLLTQLMGQMKQILEVRNQFWFRKASEQSLWEAQRLYVGVGYQLMMEIWDAVSIIPASQTLISDSTKKSLAEKLTIPFEKASAVSIPYGSNKDFCWIAIWEIDTRPECKEFVESLTHTTYDEFDEKLKDLAVTLHKQGSFLDVNLTKVKTVDLDVPCLVVSIASRKRLENFLGSEMEGLRQANRILWSNYRTPIEIIIGIEEAEARKESSGPNNAN